MKGRLNEDAWWVTEQGQGFYYAERIYNEEHQTKEFSAHCLACAKTDVLSKYGGRVDGRGHYKTTCDSFFKAMAAVCAAEEKETKDDETG